MKNILPTLLLICATFLSCQHAYAGLVGEQLFVGYNAYFSNDGGDPTFLQDFATFTVEAPFSSRFGVVVDDVTITIAPIDYFNSFGTPDGLRYNIEAVDGSLRLDWATFVTTFSNFDLSSRVTQND